MRVVADENFPVAVIELLRDAGFDVFSVREACRASPDPSVLELSMTLGRLLLTLDKDFGALTFFDRLPATCGVILFRLDHGDQERLAQVILRTLALDYEWAGHFAVVTAEKIRRRPLPQNVP